jgi:hypothetical protein
MTPSGRDPFLCPCRAKFRASHPHARGNLYACKWEKPLHDGKMSEPGGNGGLAVRAEIELMGPPAAMSSHRIELSGPPDQSGDGVSAGLAHAPGAKPIRPRRHGNRRPILDHKGHRGHRAHTDQDTKFAEQLRSIRRSSLIQSTPAPMTAGASHGGAREPSTELSPTTARRSGLIRRTPRPTTDSPGSWPLAPTRRCATARKRSSRLRGLAV